MMICLCYNREHIQGLGNGVKITDLYNQPINIYHLSEFNFEKQKHPVSDCYLEFDVEASMFLFCPPIDCHFSVWVFP
jgi:hypothetical protein